MYRLTALLPCFSKTLETNPQACTPRAVSGSNAPTWMERTLVVERLPSHYTRSYVFAWSAVHFRLVLRKHVNIFFDQNKSLIGAVWLFMSTAIVIRTAPGAQILCSAMYWFTQLPMGYPCHIAFKNLTLTLAYHARLSYLISFVFRRQDWQIKSPNRIHVVAPARGGYTCLIFDIHDDIPFYTPTMVLSWIFCLLILCRWHPWGWNVSREGKRILFIYHWIYIHLSTEIFRQVLKLIFY